MSTPEEMAQEIERLRRINSDLVKKFNVLLIADARKADGCRPTTDNLLAGARDIAAERIRQITEEGWNAVHDDRYTQRHLSRAAEAYLWGDPKAWPWNSTGFKPTDLRRNLVKAGALIAAEIDRLDREIERAKEMKP